MNVLELQTWFFELSIELFVFTVLYLFIGYIIEFKINKLQKDEKRILVITKAILESIPSLAAGVLTTNIWMKFVDPVSPWYNYFNENEYTILWFFADIFFFFTFYETFVYWFHRLLHMTKPFDFYTRFHKSHHQYKKLEDLTAFASIATDIFEIIGNAISLNVVKFIIPYPNILHYSLLLMTHLIGALAHDPHTDIFNHTKHHTKFNVHYGAYYFWDWIMGTNRQKVKEN